MTIGEKEESGQDSSQSQTSESKRRHREHLEGNNFGIWDYKESRYPRIYMENTYKPLKYHKNWDDQ